MLVLKAIWNNVRELLISSLIVVILLIAGFLGIGLCAVLAVLIFSVVEFVGVLVFGTEAFTAGLTWLGNAVPYILGGCMALLIVLVAIDHIYTEYKILKNAEEKKRLEREASGGGDDDEWEGY